MENHLKNIENKIITIDQFQETRGRNQLEQKKVVFTNGCFDILHLGHVTYLAKAADFGDVLVLGLNSDDSIKKQGKGDDRPINNELSRALLMASLSFVDYVILFDDDTPYEMIKNIQPDVLVKGGDYDENVSDPSDRKYIVGSDIVKNRGGEVKTINLVDGFSTTSILNKIKS